MSLVSAVPSGVPAPFGQRALPGVAPSIQAGTFAVGGLTMIGALPTPGAAARGKRISEKTVVHAYKTKRWGGEYEFEKDQQPGQILFNLRTGGANPQELAIATLPQLNQLLRDTYEAGRSIDRSSRLDDLDDNEQVREFIYRMRQKSSDLFMLGAANGRLTDDVRKKALGYTSVLGISTLWNYTGIYSNYSDQEMRNDFVINTAVQGPSYVGNVFQDVINDSEGLDLGRRVHADDHCHVVLKRRYSPGAGEYKEFVVEPLCTEERYVPRELLEFEDPDTGLLSRGLAYYVGKVLDVVGERAVPETVLRMRGIEVPWKDAHNAHKLNTARVKLALGPEAQNFGA